jgi:tRNA G18 (ribose-2'-O)-methylase SpoU
VQIHRVTALDRPELAPYATLRQHEEHKCAGIFVAEGDKVVRRLLESSFGVVSVLLPERRLAEFEPLVRARPEDIPVYLMEIAELEKLTGFPFFQGVLAVGKVPQAHTLDSIFNTTPRPHFFVAIDGLTNAENVGLIVRNCAAFGAQALIVDNSSASVFLRRSVRNSMGTIFKLPIVECGSGAVVRPATGLKEAPSATPAAPRPPGQPAHGVNDTAGGDTAVPNLVAALDGLRARKIRVIAAHPRAGGPRIYETNFAIDCCLVFGSEGSGLSQEVLAACDEAVTIPMSSEVDSLNVGSAAAVFLYEVARQRNAERLARLDVSVRK